MYNYVVEQLLIIKCLAQMKCVPYENIAIQSMTLPVSNLENQSTEGAEFVWVSECKKGTGCEIICIVPPMLSSGLIVVN
jgi:hypothetical protein